ncbi:NAD-dependent epimerase/dehydratase family protein [Actinomycetospora sp. CA-101289]|uniref:NAD-dependent epimerase/dehydratase family protein n=1 Tax=Actinomycetospora sp. CA-101289 TaxID=3239893 RepID=UPI003D967E6A
MTVSPLPTPADDPGAALPDRPVLVTGASGFLGRHLVRRLQRVGAEVHGLTRPDAPARTGPVAWHRADLGDADAVRAVVREVRPAAIVHLASQVRGDRDGDLAVSMLEANTRAAVTVMIAAREAPGCRVVLAGSIEEPRGDEPPVSPYAAAKAAATGYARLFHAQDDLPVTVLRIAMVYGPDQPDARKLVPHVCTALARGVAPSIGSGTRGVDWVYVEDVAEALVLAAVQPDAPGRVLDVGSGRAVTIAEVVAELADLAGHHGPLGLGAHADRPDEHVHLADPEPAAEVLGWRAHTPLRDGLARTLAWYRDRTEDAAAG